MSRSICLQLLVLVAVFGTFPAPAAATDTARLKGLEYRQIGPWRGGRVTAVAGVPGDPQRYYMGAAGGGVWQTTNAGASWKNISDKQIPVGTIGAIAVAPSDTNVIWVGTGEAPIRGVTTAQGEGLWRSTDAGQTFTFLGLPDAGQIAKIEVHPTDPDTAWIAVQGQIWAPNEARGVFRTSDGGKSFEHVLKVNADTGATDLALDPTNPRIMYAALWHHGRKPWYIKSGGEGGGIYKSIDAGSTWKKLEGGLPPLIGKVGLDVSASMPSRIYAVLEAEPDKGGLWRSDDYGKTWSQINPHRVLHSRAWYYNHLTADPSDADTVWVLNVPLMKSVDAGKTWTKVNTPHSDHHDHWINPNNSLNMINGNDGGATVTFDGGKTWSTQNNQPTVQFYRLITDNQTPYRLYAGQQDNSTVSIASASADGSIGVNDYYAVGGGESAHIAFDPDDPNLIYATTINGTLTEYDHRTRSRRYIIPYPELVYGMDSKDLKYRANWNPPVITSPHDHSTIYYGTQMVLKSTDRGVTWQEISPDLTRNDAERLGRNGGPLTPENVGAEFYHTIYYMVESESAEGTIWVGADDGLLHLTRNGGQTWDDISPPHRGEAMINAIDLSPHNEGTAYLAVTGYKLNDFDPYIYKTTDHGARWKRIDSNLPDGAFVRVVREDPLVENLLYAGTEKGMFVSYDGGDEWQSLSLNLPPVPITDLRARADSIAVATQGRGMYILDDVWVVRQLADMDEAKALHLFTPPTWSHGRMATRERNFEGKNPSQGLPLYYYLAEKLDDDATLEFIVRDESGNRVRGIPGAKGEHDECRVSNMDPRRPFKLKYPKRKQGLNRWSWGLDSDPVTCIRNIMLQAGYDGHSVAPGRYTIEVAAGEHRDRVAVTVDADPRSIANAAQTGEWSRTLREIKTTLDDVLATLDRARVARAGAKALMDAHDDEDLGGWAKDAVRRIDAWETEITQLKHQTYEDEDAWATMLDGQLRYLMDVVDGSGAPVTDGAKARLADLRAQWREHQVTLDAIGRDTLVPINEWARQRQLEHIALPAR